jgi:hypothetical protein
MIDPKVITAADRPMDRVGRWQAVTCALVGLGTLVLGCNPHKGVGTPHSIVKVQGGTIHGILTNDIWTPTDNGFWTIPSGTSDWITTHLFQTDVSGMTSTSGWVILISNSDGTNIAPNALKLCSDPGCNKTPIGANPVVYLWPGRPGVSLSLDPVGSTVRFHDDAHCDHNTGSELPACDKIVNITITKSGGATQQEVCQSPTEAPKACEIDIGH